MFTNSLLAGGLGAAYLTVLVLQLNPHVPLASATTGRWFATLAVFYGLHLAIAIYVLIVVREFFTIDAMSPGWASVRVLAWLAAIGAAVAGTMMWLNATGLRHALGETATQRMIAGAIGTSACAIVLLVIAVAHYSSGRRASRTGGALFALVAISSLVLPLAARGPAIADPPPLVRREAPAAADAAGPRIMMLLLDGASLEFVRTRAADGRLPNFSRLLTSGASMYLATVRPTHPGPVWAAAATGMYPAKNGVQSAALYYARGDSRPLRLLPDHCFSHALVRFGAIRAEDITSEAFAAPPVWRILSNAGISAGIVRWPLTFPAPAVHGFVVADRFHEVALPGQPDSGAAFPPDALAEAQPASSAETDDGDAPHAPFPPSEMSATKRDQLYRHAFGRLQRRWPARFVALRLQALDPAGHRYHHERQESFFGLGEDVTLESSAKELERAYAEVDAAIGALMAELDERDVLLVVSGFGMHRLYAAKELLARVLRAPIERGTHERAPDGFLIAYGSAVHAGRLPRGSIVDVTPTILYFLGLPIGRDMDGFVRTDLFNSAFTSDRPIAFIATHNR
jgi:hypothetical protein